MEENFLTSSSAETHQRSSSANNEERASASGSSSQLHDARDFFSKHPIFARLSDAEIQTLASASRFATVSAGEYISIEGDDKSLYGFVVVTGRLAMKKTSGNGKELTVELLGAGDIFGLLMALSKERLPVQLTARAHARTVVLWIPISTILPILTIQPALYTDFTAYLIHSLQSSHRLSRGLAHDRVEVRIATVLLTLALRFARPLMHATGHTVDITRQQVADLTGTTCETAIRVTRAMQADGLIDISRPGIIKVIDTPRLLALTEE